MEWVMKKIIYLVEDDNDINDLIKYLLADVGYAVLACTTMTAFKQALEIALPDLIILDIMLPDGDGVEICRELKSIENMQKIPIFLMSAHVNGSRMAIEACADDFISKPFDINDFTTRVQQKIAS
jgi:two-component system alkaline phosphatase synthesis response regulator PhoP